MSLELEMYSDIIKGKDGAKPGLAEMNSNILRPEA